METPVLYFYPKVTMDVTVSASFPVGRITDVFEPLYPRASGGAVAEGMKKGILIKVGRVLKGWKREFL